MATTYQAAGAGVGGMIVAVISVKSTKNISLGPDSHLRGGKVTLGDGVVVTLKPEVKGGVAEVQAEYEVEGPLLEEMAAIDMKLQGWEDGVSADLRAFSQHVVRQQGSVLRDYLAVLRWRHATRGGRRAITSTRGRDWSADGATWQPFPVQLEATVRLVHVPEIDEPAMTRAKELRDVGVREPLAHELLREADDIHHLNPRAGLVVAMVGLEVAIKEYIATSVPGSRWLAYEVPSPPLFKILRDYLPDLETAKGRILPHQPRETLTLIREAVEARNDVAQGCAAWPWPVVVPRPE
jgi:hypothetical protein